MKTAAVLFALGALGVAGTTLMRAWPWINVVETGRTPEYPDLVPRRYQAEPTQVFEAAVQAVQALSRWKVIASQPQPGEIQAEARTSVLRFVDDILIRVRPVEPPVPNGPPETAVVVRSASRVGRADFGQNVRNIRKLYEAMDRQVLRLKTRTSSAGSPNSPSSH